MIKVQHIKEIFESSEFKRDLEDLSSYAANIKQERPIVFLFAKYFWLLQHNVALEKNKCDLVVDDTRIEFKFHFDLDTVRLQRTMNNYQGDIKKLMNAVSEKKLSSTWTVVPGIYKDVIIKRPDIFVWIICARNLNNLAINNINRVCLGNDQLTYNRRKTPYESNQDSLIIFEEFLTKLQALRKFTLQKAITITNGSFPSTYYLLICDFLGAETN
jgi:hypothetical protein